MNDWRNLLTALRHPFRVLSELPDSAKHATDAIVLPGGLVVAIAGWLDLISKVFTICVLVATLVWTVYRIIDLRETIKERRTKR